MSARQILDSFLQEHDAAVEENRTLRDRVRALENALHSAAWALEQQGASGEAEAALAVYRGERAPREDAAPPTGWAAVDWDSPIHFATRIGKEVYLSADREKVRRKINELKSLGVDQAVIGIIRVTASDPVMWQKENLKVVHLDAAPNEGPLLGSGI